MLKTSSTPSAIPIASVRPILDPFNSTTWSDNERAYFESVETACRERRNTPISNGLPEHAAFIIRLFLANAQRTVRLVSGGLPVKYEDRVPVFGSFYVVAAAMDFLTRPKSEFQVIVHGELSDVSTIDNHPLVWMAKRLGEEGRLTGTLVVKKLSDLWERALRDRDMLWHWMTMDESAYRIEGDIKKPAAIVNFGEPEYTAKLAGLFDHLFTDDDNETIASVSP